MKKEKALLFFYKKAFFPKQKMNLFWKKFFETQQQESGISWIPKDKEKILIPQENTTKAKTIQHFYDESYFSLLEKRNKKEQETIVATEKDKKQKESKKIWTEKKENFIKKTKEIFIDEIKPKQEIQNSNLYEKQYLKDDTTKEKQALENITRERQKIILKENLEKKGDSIFWKWNENILKQEKRDFLKQKEIQKRLQTEKYDFFYTIYQGQKYSKNENIEKNIFLQNQKQWKTYDVTENIWQQEKQKKLIQQNKLQKAEKNMIQEPYHTKEDMTQKNAVFLGETKIDMDTLLYDMTQILLEQRQRSRKMHKGKI